MVLLGPRKFKNENYILRNNIKAQSTVRKYAMTTQIMN